MGAGLDTITGTATAPGATFTSLTAASGDTFAIRNANPGVDIWLLTILSFVNVQGVLRVRSPRLHDNVQGIRVQTVAARTLPLLPPFPLQRLYPQDTLIAEITGSAVAGQIETGVLMVYYADLPGVAARFIGPDELKRRGVNELTVEVDLTPGVGGGYTGAKALNATVDVLIANTDYALLGGTFSATVGVVTLKGADTGNLRVAIPADQLNQPEMALWFLRLSQFAGLPMVPVINSANKAGTTVEAVTSQAGTAVNVSLSLVQLAPMGVTPGVLPPAVGAPGVIAR